MIRIKVMWYESWSMWLESWKLDNDPWSLCEFYLTHVNSVIQITLPESQFCKTSSDIWDSKIVITWNILKYSSWSKNSIDWLEAYCLNYNQTLWFMNPQNKFKKSTNRCIINEETQWLNEQNKNLEDKQSIIESSKQSQISKY